MRFVIAPDSYKGSLGTAQAGHIMASAILDELPGAEVMIIPMADGGEGTVEALVTATAGRIVSVRAAGPLGSPVETSFGVLGGGHGQAEETAVFEAANIAGLTMVPADRRNPLDTTSKGLGELIMHALDLGYRRLVIGLGGSATNDGGLGLLQALGVRFYDSEGMELGGFGRDLYGVERVEYSGLDSRLQKCDIVVASDVRNPLCGQEGASMIYGPQKGASIELCALMDQAMQQYAAKVRPI